MSEIVSTKDTWESFTCFGSNIFGRRSVDRISCNWRPPRFCQPYHSIKWTLTKHHFRAVMRVRKCRISSRARCVFTPGVSCG
ncbi:hypothetical protein RSOLAG1IB_10079 [Rhizoctonia solani AG-1 IB]|uniref:Uncharacterized protein n=1 Tax=Thanatephorus cucumeris (strain AG1-IB / isolate 7/3/14) TaxID=1108050 RepID=A0A0B7FU76_THACB|nr:hypothetical protein RSOLAG1IB_10079 [Rhizoctonia solani AG-1 IB]